MQFPPVKNPMYTAFEEYREVPETVPLKFTKDDVIWVASKLSGATGTWVSNSIQLRNWLLCFGCVSEKLRVIITRLVDCMANSPLL